MSKKLKVRYYKPKSDIALDITDIQNFVYDMSRCIKCKGCTWVDHTYMPGARFMTRCPSATMYEFDAYGAHCVVGTPEAETVAELKALPFAHEFIIIPKQSLSPAIGTELPDWLDREGTPALAIVTGDCTDLCVHQVSLYLKLRANARGEESEVVVPADCVDTYDLPVGAAREIGVVPHDGELMHRLFLYHLALNGVRIVKSVA